MSGGQGALYKEERWGKAVRQAWAMARQRKGWGEKGRGTQQGTDL